MQVIVRNGITIVIGEGFVLVYDESTNPDTVVNVVYLATSTSRYYTSKTVYTSTVEADIYNFITANGMIHPFLQVTTEQRDQLTPIIGDVVWNIDVSIFQKWDGVSWINIT